MMAANGLSQVGGEGTSRGRTAKNWGETSVASICRTRYDGSTLGTQVVLTVEVELMVGS